MSEIEYTDLNFVIRIIGLNVSSVKYINEKCVALKYSVSSYFKDKNLKVISFELDKETNLSVISDVLSSCIDCYLMADIFISVSSDIQTQVIDLPSYVTRAIRHLPLNITLSYTIFSDVEP